MSWWRSNRDGEIAELIVDVTAVRRRSIQGMPKHGLRLTSQKRIKSKKLASVYKVIHRCSCY